MKNDVLMLLALTAVAGAAHLSHLQLDTRDLSDKIPVEETLPSPLATRALSLGYYALSADYYWLRALGHFGDWKMHDAKYPNLEPFLTRASHLDPQYRSVYRLAGTALTLNGMDVQLSNKILERGLKARPDVWEIPFYLGFNLYYFPPHDFERAAEILARAATLEGAPDYTSGVATRLAAESGRPEVGLRLVEEILAGIPDTPENKDMRRQYEERRDKLDAEIRLGWLNKAAEHFEDQVGRAPESLQELVVQGVLTRIPDDPLGGEFYIDSGVVKTTRDADRLRLPKVAKDQLGR